MKEMTKILFSIFFAIIFVVVLSTNVFATNIVNNTSDNSNSSVLKTNENNNNSNVNGKTSLELVENNICTIELKDLANFEKKITEFNETEKSVTLTLSLTNKKAIEEEKKNLEIFFVIDNSSSMTNSYIGDSTRKQAVIDSANSLVDKLFNENYNLKVGVVGFSSLDNSLGETEGTINDATLCLNLSSSKDEVKNAISNLEDLKVGPRTNIEAGLTLADNNFSSVTADDNVDRYIILLTDGIPNNAMDGSYAEYSNNVISRTKSKLEEIEAKDIKIIAAMVNLDGEVIEPTTNKSYRELSEEIFGTEENPTIDTFFYVPDDEIENTIVNEIFDRLVSYVDNTLKNITIKDYFPQEIIDNFDFEYVASPNIGNVTQSINDNDNSITWDISLLSEGETATLSYKLTLKSDYDKDIVDQILKTNTHVEISGENDEEELNQTSDISPTIKVKYEEPQVPSTPNKPNNNEKPITEDNTQAKEPIPQTGESSLLYIIAIGMLLVTFIISRCILIKKLYK